MLSIDKKWRGKLAGSGLGKELPRFLVAGFSAVGTDAAFYWLLLHWFSHSPSKALSFMAGTVVAFVINKYWTFERKEKSFAEVMKFAALYTMTLGANVAVNKLALFLFPGWVGLAFLAATGTSTVLNFIGQKWWVFR
jgi:putative flippase GtrA